MVYKEDVSSGGSLLGSRNRVLEGCCKGFVRILLKASEGSFLGGTCQGLFEALYKSQKSLRYVVQRIQTKPWNQSVSINRVKRSFQSFSLLCSYCALQEVARRGRSRNSGLLWLRGSW